MADETTDSGPIERIEEEHDCDGSDEHPLPCWPACTQTAASTEASEGLSEAERDALRTAIIHAGYRGDNEVFDAVERIIADRESAAATRVRAEERERIAQAIESLPTYYVQGEGGGWLHAVRTAEAARIARGDA